MADSSGDSLVARTVRTVAVTQIQKALGDTVTRGAIESVLRKGEELGLLRLLPPRAEGEKPKTNN